jgi:hypothetical protein
MSADFSVLSNLSLLTIDNALKNPLPFVLLFSIYFLAALGCIVGANLDSKTASLGSIRIVHMKQFQSFKEVPKKASGIAKFLRAFFLITNFCMVTMSICILMVSLTTFDNIVHWLFGAVGNILLVVYATFQLLMCGLGISMIGSISIAGSDRSLFVLWLALALTAIVMNAKGLEFSLHGEMAIPFHGTEDAVSIFGTFWKVAELGDKEHVMELLPSNTTCSVDVFDDENEGNVAAQVECANDLLEQVDGYLLVMGVCHILVLALLVPSGMASYVQWSLWRKRSRYAAAVASVEPTTSATAIVRPNSVKNIVENANNTDKVNADAKAIFAKDLSHAERAKLASAHSLRAGFVGGAQKHKLLFPFF